jgi:Ca2+-binding EF-hand superfamily protein
MKIRLSLILMPVMTAATLALFTASSMANEQPPREPPSFQELDTNGDNLLTKEELRGPLLDDFDRFEVDGSGSLTKEELPAPPSNQKRPS